MSSQNSRNKDFYSRYNLDNYYNDYQQSEEYMYQFLVSRHELDLISKTLFKMQDKRNANQCGLNILVLGFGFGREVDHILKTMCAQQFALTVIDFNHNFIEMGRNIYSSKKVQFLASDLSDPCNIALPSKYDLIISFNTFEYLQPASVNGLFDVIRSHWSNPGCRFIGRMMNSTTPLMIPFMRRLGKRHKSLPMLHPLQFSHIKDLLLKFNADSTTYPFGLIPDSRMTALLKNRLMPLPIFWIDRYIPRHIPDFLAKYIYFDLAC